MMNNKEIKKECCKNTNNIVIKTKTVTYREICCKKCGYIFSTITLPV